MTLCSSTSKPPRRTTTQTRLLSPVTLVNPRLASTTSPASMEADASSPSACLPSMQGSRPYERTASLLHVPAEIPSALWRGAPCLRVQSWSGSAWSSDSRTEPTSTVSTPPLIHQATTRVSPTRSCSDRRRRAKSRPLKPHSWTKSCSLFSRTSSFRKSWLTT